MKFCLIPTLSLILLLFALQLFAKPHQPIGSEAEGCDKNNSQPIPVNDTGLVAAVKAIESRTIVGTKISLFTIDAAKKCTDKEIVFYYTDFEWKMTADDPIDFGHCRNVIIKKDPSESNYTLLNCDCYEKTKKNEYIIIVCLELADTASPAPTLGDRHSIPLNDTLLVGKTVANGGMFVDDPLKRYNIISAEERAEKKNSLSFF